MIFYYIIIFLIGLLFAILSPLTLLPDVSIPPDISVAVGSIGSWFGLIWGVAPFTFTALFAALSVILGVETNIFTYKILRWIYRKIPGIS